MTQIVVDPERLADFVDRLRRAQAGLSAARDAVDARIRGVQADWDGMAAGAQAAAHQHWQAGAVQVQDALAGLEQIVRTAEANYASAIRANRTIWQAG